MSEEIDPYKGRIVQKETYYAFEVKHPVEDKWFELMIRETEEELEESCINPLLDENHQPIVDEKGKVKTASYPYYAVKE